MLSVTHSVIIARPLEEVFSFIADPRNNTRWQSGVTVSEAITPGPLGVGTRVKVVRIVMGRHVESVFNTTRFELNKRFAFKTKSGPIPLEATVSVHALPDGGTKLTLTGQAETGLMGGLFGPMMQVMVKNQIETDAKALKKLLESPPNS